MTLWNPLNVFSGQQHLAGSEPSASFDPSRTGDPLGPNAGRPAIGVGDTRVGAAGSGDPRRHPIGFAPPEERTSTTRYRTEISFKRHHELPRASATSGEPGTPEQSSPIEETVVTEAVGFESVSPDVASPDAASFESASFESVREHDEPEGVEEAPAAEEPTPFYRRELSFRRKRATPAVAVAVVDVVEGEAVEDDDGVLAQAADHEEPTEAVEEPSAPEAFEVAAAVVVAGAVDEVTETEVAALHEDHEDHEEPAATVEDDASPEITELAPVVEAPGASEVETVDEPVAEVTATEEPAADPVDEWPDVVDVVLPPVAVAEEAPETDPAAVADEAPVEDVPAPVASISSRKQRNAEKKAARNKSGHGAKGRKVVGLKIGASQIAAAVVSGTDAGFELLELARRPLAAGIVVDGEVRDEDSLALAVRALFDEEKLPRNDVRIGLSSNRIGVRTIDIAGADDEARFDNAVRFKAHEVLPVALHESVLDYRVLEERPGEEGEVLRRVLLVVAPRDQVDPYQRMAGRAGIRLTGIDLEALGLLRTFVETPSAVAPKADDTATVVVAIGHESSTLLVSGGGTCEFTRVFNWGGSALEETIADTLEVRPAEAATILRHLSLSGPGRQYESLDEITRARATEAVRLRLTPFARELVNSLQFYQTQAESLGIGGIVITGGTSHLEGLSDALHQMIGVDVSIGDPFARVTRAGDFDPAIEAAIGSMAVPIGLAIEDGSARSVNLLPKGMAQKKSRRSTAITIGVPIAAVVPLAALGFLFAGAHGKAADRQAAIDAVRAEIAALPEPRGPVIDASVVGDEAVRATAVASVLGGRLAWEGVLGDMARILPENVWLTRLSLAQPDVANLADGVAEAAPTPGQTAGTPNAVTFEGMTYSQPDVARLLARLATLPSLQRVTLTSSQSEKLGQNDVVRFVIVADLSRPGGVS